MGKTKEPVKLRQRKMPTGIISLYLDIYRNGRRTYEYLKLYLIPEKTRKDREKNNETLRLAEAIQAKRIVELRNGDYGFGEEFAEDTLFVEYYNAFSEMKLAESSGESNNWSSIMKHIENYDPNVGKRTFKEINQRWVTGFRTYLQTKAEVLTQKKEENMSPNEKKSNDCRLSPNTARSYFCKLRSFFSYACKQRIIKTNPMLSVDNIHGEETTRMYLTIEELQLLASKPCSRPSIKTAFLFSCLTGLRRSDIEKLTWGEVHQQGEYTRIIFKQKKTGGLEYLDIAPQAVELMGERKADEEPVFEYFCDSYITNLILREWVQSAGIHKEITFHCGRHTFATMMLDIGTDIYTVSKLLGHKILATTQVYAKVMDKNKQNAISSIPTILKKEDDKE